MEVFYEEFYQGIICDLGNRYEFRCRTERLRKTVIGTIEEISTDKPSNMIVVGGTEVYGMRIKFLENQHSIVLQELMDEITTVTIDAYEVVCSDGSTKLMACRITVVGVDTVDLRDCQ